MYLLKQDIDSDIKVADISQHYQIKGLGNDNISKGIKKLSNEKEGGLESTLGVISIILIFGSLFFLLSNLTGYTIANLSKTYFNPIGTILFTIGIIIAFFYLKK